MGAQRCVLVGDATSAAQPAAKAGMYDTHAALKGYHLNLTCGGIVATQKGLGVTAHNFTA